MSSEPPRPPEEEPPDKGYEMIDEPAPPRPAPPVEADELSLDELDQPRPKKRRRRRRPGADGEGPAEEPDEEPDDLLDRAGPVAPAYAWWTAPAILLAFGLILCVVPIVVLAVQAGAAVGAAAVLLTAVGLVVQVAVVTVLLMMIGQFFGIDYGPAAEAVLKLAAVVAVVDGLTAVLFSCTPLALVVAAIVGAGVFQYLFRLAIFEMLLSVAGMVAAAWVLNAALLAILVHKHQKKAGNAAVPAAVEVADRGFGNCPPLPPRLN